MTDSITDSIQVSKQVRIVRDGGQLVAEYLSPFSGARVFVEPVKVRAEQRRWIDDAGACRSVGVVEWTAAGGTTRQHLTCGMVDTGTLEEAVMLAGVRVPVQGLDVPWVDWDARTAESQARAKAEAAADLEAVRKDLATRQVTWFESLRPGDLLGPPPHSDAPRCWYRWHRYQRQLWTLRPRVSPAELHDLFTAAYEDAVARRAGRKRAWLSRQEQK